MILAQRLSAHKLVGAPLPDAPSVVRWMCAVQAQDFPGARWALGLRARGITDADTLRAIDDGEILRTHVLRPTWHFVARDDIRWLLALTAPRILASLAFRQRFLELDARTLARSRSVLEKTLRDGRSLTRPHLAAALRRARITTTPERVGHILVAAELQGVICSGRLENTQHTYALLDERVPPAPPKPREEAVALLARRYVQSHRPATAADFAWWSGLTLRDARIGLGVTGDDGHDVRPARPSRRPTAWLLPAYDEYLVAYRDRSAVLDPPTPDFRDALGPTVIVDGKAVANWRRAVKGGRLTIELRPRRRLTAAERTAIARAVLPYLEFNAAPGIGGQR